MRFVAVLLLTGCLYVLPAPKSTGIERGAFGECVDAECPGGFGCDDYGYCTEMCFEDDECKDGWRCCDYDDTGGSCTTYECVRK